MNLRASHYGYTYQDLLTAVALVDLILGTAVGITVDAKGFDEDRFDDLTTVYRNGRRVRIQIKHTAQDRELSKATFSADRRSLKLNLLFDSLLSDLASQPGTSYRVVVRDGAPDEDLAKVLKPVDAAGDPGDPLPGVTTHRYKFDAQALRANEPWKGLVEYLAAEQLQSACEHLIIDTSAPASTINMAAPGPAELALLRRVTEELGAGRPPNRSRAPVDVALALTHAATAARTLNGDVTREDISPRIGLTTDFGAVAEGHPIEKAFAVTRISVTARARQHIEAATSDGGRIVLTGEPGVGKSWLCEQLAETYRDDKWIVARHHCWLGSTDIDRYERVLTDVVIGSLLSQLEELVPEATNNVRPRFAATPETLEAALRACRDLHPDRNVLLIVDGLDHVDRVLGRHTNKRPDPSRLLVEQLANIELPPGVGMLIASQPGPHLDRANPFGGQPVQMQRMSWGEVRTLAQRHHLIDPDDGRDKAAATVDDERAIVDLLHDRSAGNSLYATYLCRHATRVSPLEQDSTPPPAAADIVHRLSQVPTTTNDLDAYYAHLLEGLTGDQEVAIGALALCDFALSPDELGEMVPEVTLFLASALATLAPVLNSQPGLGGLRVHHESFSRYILRDQPEAWIGTIRGKAAAWLDARGFFTDSRAFRHLPELLAHLDKYSELKDLIRPGFVADAICALQPPEALKRVVGAVARESEARFDWPTLIACIETVKAIDVYESQSLPDTLVHYADVVVSILGAEAVAERLLYKGRATFPARWGLGLCRAVDRAGTSAPWEAYLHARNREEERERSSYASDNDGDLHLAIQLGHLRVRGQGRGFDNEMVVGVAENLDGDHTADLDELVEVFTCGLPAGVMPSIAAKMTDSAKAARVYLKLADLAVTGARALPEPGDLAREAQRRAPVADLIRYLRHGIPPSEVLAGLGIGDFESDLQAATVAVTAERSPEFRVLRHWLSLLTLAHALDRMLPLKLTSELIGIGFYRAFLRFAVATIGINADVTNGVTTPQDASTTVRVALEQLANASEAFTGTPRACDLYYVHPLIHEVIENALVVVQPEDLDQVLDHLMAIGDGTTTSLMGMAENGPLATNDLLEVLARVSNDIGVDATHALVAGIRDRRHDTHGMYPVAADFELAAARICLAAGATDEAAECWARAATLLASYGGHKDPSISEFIDSIEDLAAVDTDAARAALGKLLDPAYLVRQHTDGRGTDHIPRSWWETCARVDPIAAALDGSSVFLGELGFEDARVQTALEELLDTQTGSADPIVLAALRMAAGSDWRGPTGDLEILTRLQPEVGSNPRADAVIAAFANNIAASYDDQPMMYASDTNKSVATSELIEAVVKVGGSAFDVRTPRKDDEQNNSVLERRDEPTDILKRLESGQRPLLPGGPGGAIAAARDFDSKDHRADATAARWDPDALANAIGWRVLETTEESGSGAGIALLDDVAREISTYSDNEVFAVVGEGLAARCDKATTPFHVVASYCLTLAFIRIRGGGGWRNFAGRERVDLWVKAYLLDPGTAERTLAAAAAGSPALGVYGVTQAVIAALAAQPTTSPGGTAIECWNAGYAVLQARLPGTAARGHHTYNPTPIPEDPDDLNNALATLAVASISQGMRADLRRALLAVTLLLTCRPDIGQTALVWVLNHQLDSGRTTWLLETVRDGLQAGRLTPELAATLTRLTQTDRLSVRVLAAETLAGHGHPVPGPPATQPAAEVRIAFRHFVEEDE